MSKCPILFLLFTAIDSIIYFTPNYVIPFWDIFKNSRVEFYLSPWKIKNTPSSPTKLPLKSKNWRKIWDYNKFFKYFEPLTPILFLEIASVLPRFKEINVWLSIRDSNKYLAPT